MIRQPYYQTLVVLIMLTSWLFMLATSTCVMPSLMQVPVESVVMPADCNDVTHHMNQVGKTDIPAQDCLLKPCPDSQQYPALNSKIGKIDVPVAVLALLGIAVYVYSLIGLRVFPKWQSEVFANGVPIRYRFCVLRN